MSSSFFKHPVLYYKEKLIKRKYRHGSDITQETTKQIGKVHFPVLPSLNSRHLKKIYYGSYQFEVCETLKRHLKGGDVFFDIGANIGYITAFAASLVGKEGQVHCFEPVKQYFDYINKVVKLNPDFSITTNNFALGEKTHTAQINVADTSSHLGSSSMVKGFLREQLVKETVDVAVDTFDNYIASCNNVIPSFIKIDVEGYEFFVLKGMRSFFENNKSQLPPILVELTPGVYPGIGTSITEIQEYLSGFGYRPYCFMGNHPVELEKIEKQQDILFRQ